MQNKMSKRVVVLLPDGVGLKNFVFSSFPLELQKRGFDLIFWNNTSFSIKSLGFNEITLPKFKVSFFSVILKDVKKTLLLDKFSDQFGDEVYQTYKFEQYKFSWHYKFLIKFIFYKFFIILFRMFGVGYIQGVINFIERNSKYYKYCKDQLGEIDPSFIFCTNQRHLSSVSPLLASSDLGIINSTFIFSWDNLPKATMVVDTDYYFVWSDFMKNELLSYYPYIDQNHVFVIGTPQFEFHFHSSNIIPKEIFFSRFNLNDDHDYVCFSGDDITTSPYDPIYLNDLALAISEINLTLKKKVAILFRRCPVDFSDRFDSVLDQFKEIIIPINPSWKSFGKAWNEIMPTPEDIKLLTSTIFYSKMVFNLGSSMVFDFVIFDKPCFYFNYNPVYEPNRKWSVEKIYNYIHFRSMPSDKAVLWVDNKSFIGPNILKILDEDYDLDLTETRKWFNKIVSVSPDLSSSTLCEKIDQIITE